MGKFTILDLIDLELEDPNALELRCVCARKGLSKEIYSTEINRPGLALTGFFEKFVGKRIQIIGRGEYAYLEEMPEDKLKPCLDKLFSYDIPCFIFCYNLEPPASFRMAADESGTPLLMTPLDSSALSIRLLRALDDVFAPRQTIHAVFVEVEGMGVLIQGESGVGKSETALELLDRGHRLIADDAVLIKCLNGNTLWGYGTSKMMGHHMEIRGLGIIDISQVYGLNSVRDRKPVEMVFQLEEWDNEKIYDRLGTSGETTSLLGVTIPRITLPVKPGRNIPIIIEAAVLNERLKSQGVNAAKEFNKNLIQWIESENARNLWFDRFANRRGSK
ncbi:MAG: HPr(Ser) kinase/phosphatase [Spirochaetales bacterium]|nr:HPr(Ser) kinase/phosphatase [Spirochaetales bacterium]